MAPLLKFLFRSDFVAPCAMGGGEWHSGMSFSPFSRSAPIDDNAKAGAKAETFCEIANSCDAVTGVFLSS